MLNIFCGVVVVFGVIAITVVLASDAINHEMKQDDDGEKNEVDK